MLKKLRKKIYKISPRWVRWIYYLAKTTKVKIITWVPRYNEDELMTGHLCEFRNDSKFRNAYDKAVGGGIPYGVPKLNGELMLPAGLEK